MFSGGPFTEAVLDVADDGDALDDAGLFTMSNARFVELAINEEPLTESVAVEMLFTGFAVVVAVVVAAVLVVVMSVVALVALPTSSETNAQIYTSDMFQSTVTFKFTSIMVDRTRNNKIRGGFSTAFLHHG